MKFSRGLIFVSVFAVSAVLASVLYQSCESVYRISYLNDIPGGFFVEIDEFLIEPRNDIAVLDVACFRPCTVAIFQVRRTRSFDAFGRQQSLRKYFRTEANHQFDNRLVNKLPGQPEFLASKGEVLYQENGSRKELAYEFYLNVETGWAMWRSRQDSDND